MATKNYEFGNFINGEWRPGIDGQSQKMICPSDGLPFGTIAKGNEKDINEAVQAARQAFENGPWKHMTATERGRMLLNLSNKIAEHFDELAELESRDTGKIIVQARADITASIRYFEYFGTAGDKFHGDVVPFLDGYLAVVLHDPKGVTGHIIPWNYPAQMFGRTIAPALAMGNCTVLKPASDACLSVLRMVELSQEVGFPPGVINVVTGPGQEAGKALAGNNGINFIAFTGSAEVGSTIQAAAAQNHIGCSLELGGKSPNIVFEDANLDDALPFVINAILQNCGQTCSAGSRLLVQETIYDKFVKRVADKFSQLKVGSHDMGLDSGPLISAVQKERTEKLVEKAKKEGVKVLSVGKIDKDVPSGGFYFSPILFGPVPKESMLAREEVFGPVLSAIPFKDENEAIAIANGTDYGLIAGVWTLDGSRQMRVAKAMQCGQVYINAYGAGGGIELPFGGMKKSGHGREKGMEALREFSDTKTLIFRHGI